MPNISGGAAQVPPLCPYSVLPSLPDLMLCERMILFTQLRTLQWHTQEFCLRGVQQIQLRTEDRENRDLGAVAPPSEGFWRQL
jgi:hypothetical protein